MAAGAAVNPVTATEEYEVGPDGRRKKKRPLSFYERLRENGVLPPFYKHLFAGAAVPAAGFYGAGYLYGKHVLPSLQESARALSKEEGAGLKTQRHRDMLARARTLMPDVTFYGQGDATPPGGPGAGRFGSYYRPYGKDSPSIYLGDAREASLAHEMGHHLNRKSLNSVLGNRVSPYVHLGLSNLLRYGRLGGAAAFALGGRTGRKWAWMVPLLAGAPSLADEALASIRGWRYAPALGMKPEDAAAGKMELLKAFGSYALPVAGSSLGLYLAHRLVDSGEEEKKEETADAGAAPAAGQSVNEFQSDPYLSAVRHGLGGALIGAGAGAYHGGTFSPGFMRSLRNYNEYRQTLKTDPLMKDPTNRALTEMALQSEANLLKPRFTHPLYGALLGAGLGAGYSGLRSYLGL